MSSFTLLIHGSFKTSHVRFYNTKYILRHMCTSKDSSKLYIGNQEFKKDKWTNVNPKILSYLNRKLYLKKYHPLFHVKKQIENYMYNRYQSRFTSPLFSVIDNLQPIVTVEQNFDSLLVPENHISRNLHDSYYLNKNWMLRAHTSAHQSDLLKTGLNNFLVFGDVYRRDSVDKCHYPVFHQMEGVQTCDRFEIFGNNAERDHLKLFEEGKRSSDKQESHTLEAVKLTEHNLKLCLVGLAETLFGINELKYRWVDTYFPFTHPSWELEVFYENDWLEVLGCGVMEQKILNNAGAQDRIGWAFGLGLERLAMKLYEIPDIRLFWSEDSGFLSQFEFEDSNRTVKYKAVSKFPQCINDISFWIPDDFDPKSFLDIVREIGDDSVEQVTLIDEFTHPKTKISSQAYRIVYRHMEQTLTKDEVNVIHKKIENECTRLLNVEIR